MFTPGILPYGYGQASEWNSPEGVNAPMPSSLTAAEVMMINHHMQAAIAGVRFLNHCANETSDTQFKQLCQQFSADKQRSAQQMMTFLNTTATVSAPILQ